METEVLESLIDGAEETDTLEFKAAIPWSRETFLKDILALANTIDGGRIIVGVEDGTFTRQGLTAEQIATYDLDIMRDQIAPYADPYVSFRREVVADRQGLNFVVIEVSSFEEIPIICRRDGNDIFAGTIYFRSRSGRPQSARISNSSDLREVIEVAISRRRRGLERVSLVPTEAAQYDYDNELGGL